MKRHWVAAAMAPLSFAAAQAHADDLTISAAQATPVTTANAKAGSLTNAGNITFASGGSINPTAAGAAVTVNSSNSVSILSGAGIGSTGVNGVTGVQAQGGWTGSISNAGTISLGEATNYQDTNGDGVQDSNSNVLGQFATGTGRVGIEVTPGTGLFTGSITNSGAINIIGEKSAGILIDPGAGITGDLAQSGTITAVGGNSGATDPAEITYGIHTLGSVGGNVTVSGTVTATGQNAAGVVLGGDVGGAVNVNGTITATGYRSTTASTSPTILNAIQTYKSSELLQGGPALQISGDVGQGVNLAAPVAASTGVTARAGAAITSYGRAPAVLIGGGAPINIGLSGTTGYGLVVGGTVSGLGTYDTDNLGNPVGANGMQIGVAYDGTNTPPASALVNIAGGVSVSGTLTAVSISKTSVNGLVGDATALQINSATTPKIDVSGTVSASVSSPSTSDPAVSATAILLGPSASVSSLNNTNTIKADITGIPAVTNVPAAGGTQGYATAIRDLSGNLTSVTNTNLISATLTPIDPTQTVDLTKSSTVAIDLSHNTVGASVTQNAYTPPVGATTTTTVTPTIIGDVMFGSGAGTLNLNAGTMTGGLSYGASLGNALNITGGAALAGPLAESAGGQLAVNIAKGSLDITRPTSATLPTPDALSPAQAPIGVSSVNVGAQGKLIFSVNATGAGATDPQFVATGPVTFATGSQLGLRFLDKLTQTTTYDVIEASTGQITLGGVTASLANTPFLYSGAISQTNLDPGHDAISITVHRKTAQELGFNPAEAAAYDAVYAAFDKPDTLGVGSIADAVLGVTDQKSFLHLYDQFLPSYSGGPFETLIMAQQGLARAEAETPDKLETDTTRGWVQEIGIVNRRNSDSSVNGYDGKGFGVAGGMERAHGRGALGVAAAFISTTVNDSGRPDGSSNGANAVEAGVYWRRGGEGLNLGASFNGGWAFLESHRVLLQQTGTANATLYRQAKAHWNGAVAAASLSLGYKESFGRFYVRPEVLADYVLLYEGAYSEHGGGDAFDLHVGSRTSTEGVVQADMVIGATFGDSLRWTPEMTVGWREIVTGGPADVTARFNGGSAFTLSPVFQDRGGLLARLGLRASGTFADFSANAGGVFRSGYETYDARATARFLF